MRGAELEIGWSDAAGECSMLVAYGIHLLRVRAHSLGESEETEWFRENRFAEIRGHLAERTDTGFRLQALRASDPSRLALADATESERAIWQALESRCVCPACVMRTWTAAEADALAADLERDPKTAARRLGACMVRTPALLRAAMLAGMHPGGAGWRRARVWGPRSIEDAAKIAEELRTHRRKDVREAAVAALTAAERR